MLAFGDEYQGMTDREILIDIAGRVKILEEDKDSKNCDRKSWRDYVVNGSFVLGASLISFLIGKGA